MSDPTPADALFDRLDPNKVRRLDEPPAGAVGKSFTVQGTRPLVGDWRGFANTYAADPACAGDPLGMVVTRADTAGQVSTTVTIYWAAIA